MKNTDAIIRVSIFLLFLCNTVCGQTQSHKDKFKKLEPDIWLGIWDKANSSEAIQVDTLSYDEIPKELEFKGTVVEALAWEDYLGKNILIQTVTGHFSWKDYDEDSTSFMLQDKWELYAYLFCKTDRVTNYKRIWRIYDYLECFGVDWFAGFIPKGTTITDIDHNGIAEISIPYVLICRGGMDPGTMKIIAYEGDTKYAIRGETMLFCDSDAPYGGKYSLSDNLKQKEAFKNFLLKRWNTHKCENDRFY